MTPKEKAKELVEKYKQYSRGDIYEEVFKAFNLKHGEIGRRFKDLALFSRDYHAKQCALFAVEELIKEQEMWQNGECETVKYWQQVKTEIDQL